MEGGLFWAFFVSPWSAELCGETEWDCGEQGEGEMLMCMPRYPSVQVSCPWILLLSQLPALQQLPGHSLAAGFLPGKLKPSNSSVPLAEPGASRGMNCHKWVCKPSAFPSLCLPAALGCTGQWWHHFGTKERRTRGTSLGWTMRVLSPDGLCNDTPDPFSPSNQDLTVLLCPKQSFAQQ